MLQLTQEYELIPRFYMLRRVPVRYRSVLPLPVIKRYQCLVIGGANGVLTVATTSRLDRRVQAFLSYLTGRPIFLVFVNAARMRLLIQRVERDARRREQFFRRSRFYQLPASHPLLLHSFVTLLASHQRGNAQV